MSATMDWGDATIKIQLRTSVSMAAAGTVRTAAGVFCWALFRFFTAVLVVFSLQKKKKLKNYVQSDLGVRVGDVGGTSASPLLWVVLKAS